MTEPDGDFFTWWQKREEREAAASTRSNLEEERAFWRQRAATYDEIGSLARAAPVVVDRLTQLVWPGSTVFEIGAGTGEFTVPLARIVSRVTAVDLSASMLDVLRQKLAVAQLTNVTTIEGDWEETDLPPHEVVLAVNSLYRLRDPRRSLSRMIGGARRRGIILNSVGANPPPTPEALVHFGRDRYNLGLRHGLLVAGLAELGVAASVEIISVPRTYNFPNIAHAASSLVPWRDRTSGDLAAAEDIARQTMELQPDGRVLYQYDGRVAIITWDTDSKHFAE